MKRKNFGFTLIELLAVISIIALLLAILLPVFAVARARALTNTCVSNIRQVALSIQQYVDEYDARFPASITWDNWRSAHPEALLCPTIDIKPGDRYRGVPGYAYNNYICTPGANILPPGDDGAISLSMVKYPSATVLLCEEQPTSVTSDTADECNTMKCDNYNRFFRSCKKHLGGANYAFVDGHVKWYRPSDVYDKTRFGNNNPRPFDGSYPTFQAY